MATFVYDAEDVTIDFDGVRIERANGEVITAPASAVEWDVINPVTRELSVTITLDTPIHRLDLMLTIEPEPTLAMKRQLVKHTGVELPRYRAKVWRWTPPHERLDVGVYSLDWLPVVTSFQTRVKELAGPWRVRLDMLTTKTEFTPCRGCDGKGTVRASGPAKPGGLPAVVDSVVKVCGVCDGGRRKGTNRGRRFFTATVEADDLKTATEMALIELDEAHGRGWYAVKLRALVVPQKLVGWSGVEELRRAIEQRIMTSIGDLSPISATGPALDRLAGILSSEIDEVVNVAIAPVDP